MGKMTDEQTLAAWAWRVAAGDEHPHRLFAYLVWGAKWPRERVRELLRSVAPDLTDEEISDIEREADLPY
jgi:hypothetical protein